MLLSRHTRRREFIMIIGGAATWPLAAPAQQPAMPVIGWLSSLSPEGGKPNLEAFRKALADAGCVEGQNVQIEYRWANGNYDQLPAMAADLVGRRVALIATSGGEPPAFAAKAATATISHRDGHGRRSRQGRTCRPRRGSPD
jgi:putative ABC transport system substrate-binding protein